MTAQPGSEPVSEATVAEKISQMKMKLFFDYFYFHLKIGQNEQRFRRNNKFAVPFLPQASICSKNGKFAALRRWMTSDDEKKLRKNDTIAHRTWTIECSLPSSMTAPLLPKPR